MQMCAFLPPNPVRIVFVLRTAHTCTSMTGNQKPKPSVVVKLLKYLYLSLCLLCPHIRTRYKCFASRCSANAEVCVCMAIARLERTQRGTHVTLPSSRRRTHLQRCATTPPRTLSRTLPSPAHTPAQTCLCPSKRACASTRCRARGAHHTSPSTGVTTPRLLSRLPHSPQTQLGTADLVSRTKEAEGQDRKMTQPASQSKPSAGRAGGGQRPRASRRTCG